MRVLLIDNYDSFTWNLAHQLGKLGAEVHVVRNDAIDLAGVRTFDPSHIVLSPGPGHPANARDFGVCGAILDALSTELPILGVCLGHHGIVARLGGEVVRAAAPVHGKPDAILHDGGVLFAALPSPFQAMRYHSLVAAPASLPPGLQVTARLADGTIMAVHRVGTDVHGVQFHPESIGTPDGDAIIAAFLALGPSKLGARPVVANAEAA